MFTMLNNLTQDLTTAVQQYPDNPQGFFHRGCLLKERNPAQALQVLSKFSTFFIKLTETICLGLECLFTTWRSRFGN